ncbi:MAG: asparagine synthase (glutamine-hydrolyzing) [Candidatus Binatia bacterium]
MCGIAGEVRGSGVDRDAATRMAERLRHRGPDQRSIYVSRAGRCALAHARLRVIDLATGEQPMSNEDGSVWVVFNGEIYDFQALRRELEARGHAFRSRSDTEVIVHGYEEWGDRLPERLDGMFALAIWDERRQRLFLARDRAGKKPLYVYRDDERLLFASEIKAILEHPGADRSIEPSALPLYLTYGYVPSPLTFYRRIRKLPAASCLALEADRGTREWSYWGLDFTPRSIRAEEADEEIRARMRAAVRRRMIADVPLGAFLSGGIDSTIVVGLMSEAASAPVRTFSIGYSKDPLYDETSYARAAASRFGTLHTKFMVGPQSIDLVDRLVDAYDEPFGDSSAIPTYIVSELARRDVTVALVGDGGDELFAGYLRFYAAALSERVPVGLFGLAASLARRLPYHPSPRSPSRRFTRFIEAASLPLEDRMLRWIGFFAGQVKSLLRPELAAEIDERKLAHAFREPLERTQGLSPLSRVLDLNFRTYLLDDLLPKADRCSMAHGLELRSPFLDTTVMEFAASLPDGLKLRRGATKVVLRRAFRDLLPEEIQRRGKMGFGIPLPDWFRNEWRPLVEARLLDPGARLYEWLRPEPVRSMAEQHFAEASDHGHQLWALLTLETWLERRAA